MTGPARRPRIIDPYPGKIEWVDRSRTKISADVAHERLVAVGFGGDERTTRRAVAEAKAGWRQSHRHTYRPWIAEPGLWLQFDRGTGPVVPGPDGRPTHVAAERECLHPLPQAPFTAALGRPAA